MIVTQNAVVLLLKLPRTEQIPPNNSSSFILRVWRRRNELTRQMKQWIILKVQEFLCIILSFRFFGCLVYSCVCVCVRARAPACMRVCVRVRLRACVCVCVYTVLNGGMTVEEMLGRIWKEVVLDHGKISQRFAGGSRVCIVTSVSDTHSITVIEYVVTLHVW
jgi:hypothetical protein